MNRLLQIEWLKLKHYRPFWVLSGMYALCAILVCSSGMFFLEFVKREGGDFNGIDPTIIPLYDFPDVWHNVTWISFLFKIILAFIVVVSIANESNFRTLRQNVIDGLSKKEFLISKLLLLFAVSLAATILLFFIGLITGLIYSNVQGVEYVFQNLEFLLAYLLGTFTFLTFALLITLILPKAGLVIVGLLMYTLIFEPLLALFLENYPKLSEFWSVLAQFLPVNALSDLIHVPFPKYILMEIQDYVSIEETLIAIGWLAFNIGMSYFVLHKKDW